MFVEKLSEETYLEFHMKWHDVWIVQEAYLNAIPTKTGGHLVGYVTVDFENNIVPPDFNLIVIEDRQTDLFYVPIRQWPGSKEVELVYCSDKPIRTRGHFLGKKAEEAVSNGTAEARCSSTGSSTARYEIRMKKY